MSTKIYVGKYNHWLVYKKKIALIGIGYWGLVHYKYLKKLKNIYIKKIYFRKNKPKLISETLLTNKIDEIKKNININYIDIVTPIKTHSKILLDLIKIKDNILVEKPLLMDNYQEKQIQKYIDKKKRIIV